MLDENKSLVRRFINAIWNQGNWDLIDEILTPEYVRHDPSWPDAIHGPAALREYVSTIRQAFADLEVAIDDLVAEGDKVVVRWRMKGTHQGDFMGIRATWREVGLAGLSMHHIENGRILETWDGYDTLGLMQQMGVIP